MVTSNIHLWKLLDLSVDQNLFIPATLYRAYKEQKIHKILPYFVWAPRHANLSSVFPRLIEKTQIYEYKEENVKEILPQIDRIRLPSYAKTILLEEYSFLKEKSALLLRFRKVLQYFRNMSIPFLDVTNKLKDEKERIFHKMRGLRWVTAFLLECAAPFTTDPLLSKVLTTTKVILLVLDP